MNQLVSFRLCTLSNDELMRKVDEMTDAMFQTQRVPDRHIPARPNGDYDLLVGELIKRLQLTLQAIPAPGQAWESGIPEMDELVNGYLQGREITFNEFCTQLWNRGYLCGKMVI